MDRHYFVWILLLGGFPLIQAQTLDRAVLSPQGQSDHTPTLSIVWTLGELATATLRYPGGQLTEGFHQPDLQVTQEVISSVEEFSPLNVQLRPNPVQSFLQVLIRSEWDEEGFIELLDGYGHLLRSIRTNLKLADLELDLSAYPSGLYPLRISTGDGRIIKAFKVHKIR